MQWTYFKMHLWIFDIYSIKSDLIVLGKISFKSRLNAKQNINTKCIKCLSILFFALCKSKIKEK